LTPMPASPYLDLEPEMWRSLLARAAVFHATRTRLSALCDSATNAAVQRALLDLDMQIRDTCANESDDDALVAGVVKAWDCGLTQLLEHHTLDTESRELLVTLRELVRSASGSDPFRQLFMGVTSMASALYGSAWRPATLHLCHIRSHPRGGPLEADPYALTATTPWPPDEVHAAVEVHVYPDAFGPAAYAALPMFLTHECVCHVPARQDRAKNDSPFAEGLLDWAAYFFLEQWAGKLDRELAPAARKHARKLRSLLTSRVDTPEGRARQVGHDAAETLLTWYEETYDLDRHDCELRVARLAVQINKLDRPLRAKDNLVSRLSWPIPPDLDETLRAWEAGHLPDAALLQ
jgi:hypothetical protein